MPSNKKARPRREDRRASPEEATRNTDPRKVTSVPSEGTREDFLRDLRRASRRRPRDEQAS